MTGEPVVDLRRDLVGGLLESLELIGVLNDRLDAPEIRQITLALGRVVAAVDVLVTRPEHLLVTHEHRDAAVELTTAYLDRAENYQLLLGSLTALDDRGRVDPEFRLGLLTALGQLVADALTVAVASTVDGDDEILGESQQGVDRACRSLLSRLVLVTRD